MNELVERRRRKRLVLEAQLRQLDQEEQRQLLPTPDPTPHSSSRPLSFPALKNTSTVGHGAGALPPSGQVRGGRYSSHSPSLSRPPTTKPFLSVTPRGKKQPVPSEQQVRDDLVTVMNYRDGIYTGSTLAGHQFDVYALFATVIQMGGSSTVTSRDAWPVVAALLHFPSQPSPSIPRSSTKVGAQLRTFFLRKLGDLEVLWERTKQADEAAQAYLNANARPQAKSPSSQSATSTSNQPSWLTGDASTSHGPPTHSSRHHDHSPHSSSMPVSGNAQSGPSRMTSRTIPPVAALNIHTAIPANNVRTCFSSPSAPQALKSPVSPAPPSHNSFVDLNPQSTARLPKPRLKQPPFEPFFTESFDDLVSLNLLPLPLVNSQVKVPPFASLFHEYAWRAHEIRGEVRKLSSDQPHRTLAPEELSWWNQLVSLLQRNPSVVIPRPQTVPQAAVLSQLPVKEMVSSSTATIHSPAEASASTIALPSNSAISGTTVETAPPKKKKLGRPPKSSLPSSEAGANGILLGDGTAPPTKKVGRPPNKSIPEGEGSGTNGHVSDSSTLLPVKRRGRPKKDKSLDGTLSMLIDEKLSSTTSKEGIIGSVLTHSAEMAPSSSAQPIETEVVQPQTSHRNDIGQAASSTQRPKAILGNGHGGVNVPGVASAAANARWAREKGQITPTRSSFPNQSQTATPLAFGQISTPLGSSPRRVIDLSGSKVSMAEMRKTDVNSSTKVAVEKKKGKGVDESPFTSISLLQDDQAGPSQQLSQPLPDILEPPSEPLTLAEAIPAFDAPEISQMEALVKEIAMDMVDMTVTQATPLAYGSQGPRRIQLSTTQFLAQKRAKFKPITRVVQESPEPSPKVETATSQIKPRKSLNGMRWGKSHSHTPLMTRSASRAPASATRFRVDTNKRTPLQTRQMENRSIKPFFKPKQRAVTRSPSIQVLSAPKSKTVPVIELTVAPKVELKRRRMNLVPIDRAKVVLSISRRSRAKLIQMGVYDAFRDDDSEDETVIRRHGHFPLRPLKTLPKASSARPARPRDPEVVLLRFLHRPGPGIIEPFKSILTEESILNRAVEHVCGWKGCDAIMASEALLRRHVEFKRHVDQGSFQAGVWGATTLWRCHWRGCEEPCFDSEANLSQHIVARHVSRILPCPFTNCEFISPNVSHLARHVMKQHDDANEQLRPNTNLSTRHAPSRPIPNRPLPAIARTDELATLAVRGSVYMSGFRQEWAKLRVANSCFAGDDPIIHVEHPPHMLQVLDEGSDVKSVSDGDVLMDGDEMMEQRLLDRAEGKNRRWDVVVDVPKRPRIRRKDVSGLEASVSGLEASVSGLEASVSGLEACVSVGVSASASASISASISTMIGIGSSGRGLGASTGASLRGRVGTRSSVGASRSETGTYI